MKVEGGKHSFLKLPARHVIGERIGGHLLLHLMQLLGVTLCIHHRLGYLVVKLATGFLQVHLRQLPVVACLFHAVPAVAIINRYGKGQREVFALVVAKLRGKPIVLPFLREILIIVGRNAATERE